jgi:transglutaminase-like putative cysteine protease
MCMLVCATPALTQPGWVKDAIKESQGMALHPDAPSFILLKEQRTEVSEDGWAKIKARYAVKVLKAAGKNHAVYSFPIRSDVHVSNLKGWRVRVNGDVHKLEKDYIVEVARPSRAGYYDDQKVLWAGFPQVDVGDIFAFEYEIKEKDSLTAFHQGFVFQELSPVLKSRFELKLPEGWTFHLSQRFADQVSYERDGDKYSWSMGFLAYRPEEPYMPPLDEVYREVEVACYHPARERNSYLRSWATASRFAWAIHDAQAKPTDTIRNFVHSLIGGVESKADQLEIIADFVRDEIRYVAVEIGEGGFRPRSAETTLLNRYGDCKDKSTLLRSMLRAVNMPSLPVLAKIGDQRVDTTFPSLSQFNHCITAVPAVELQPGQARVSATMGKWLLFDPTNEHVPLGILPSALYSSPILFLNPDSSSIRVLPEFSPDQDWLKYQGHARVTSDGRVNADVTITSYNAYGTEMDEALQAMSDEYNREAARNLFLHCLRSPEISNFESRSEPDSTVLNFDLAGSQYLSDAGQMRLLKADCFHADLTGTVDGDERRFPVWLGRPHAEKTTVTWSLPDGWTAPDEPVSISAECTLGEIKCRATKTDSTFTIFTTEKYFGGTVLPRRYNEVKEFLAARAAAHGMRVILTQK